MIYARSKRVVSPQQVIAMLGANGCYEVGLYQ